MKKHLIIPVVCSVVLAGCGGSSGDSTPASEAENSIQSDSSPTNSNTADNDDVVASGEVSNDGASEDSSDVANNSDVNNSDTDVTNGGSSAGSTDDVETAESDDSANVTDAVEDSDSSESTDSSETTDTNGGSGGGVSELSPLPDFEAVPPSGLLATAQPEFIWPAVAGAEQYKIVVKDAGDSGYERVLDPMVANCQTGEGMCSATTSLAYYDNHLTWYVESTVNGAPGPTSDTYNITTPFSENLQGILSNNVDQCEGWAAVAYDKYIVLNNTWNARTMANDSWSQVINVTENANGTVTPSWTYDWLGQFDTNTQFGEYEVKAYPEVLYGPKLGTHVSGTREETGLPAQVATLPEFVVDYDFSETLDEDAERNVALEAFFHPSDDIRGPCDFDENGDSADNRAFEMMIWVNNPTIRTPGDLELTAVMIDNQLWDVYIKPNSNKHYIAFTANNPSTMGTLNWKRFVDWTADWTAANADALEIDVLERDFYMGAIEIGTEMWWGAGSFTLNRFDVRF